MRAHMLLTTCQANPKTDHLWAGPHVARTAWMCTSLVLYTLISLQNPETDLWGTHWVFVPLPNVAILTESFICLLLLI